jgi:ferredoxin-thioredoxin reductase catalytic chain
MNDTTKKLYDKLLSDAQKSGYNLNPDLDFTVDLVEGLVKNIERYGYQACPCRLADGKRETDLDIICPCDYRDPDLADFDACYCGLYVSDDIVKGKKKLTPIPERRSADRQSPSDSETMRAPSQLSYPVWRCKVCGYICARNEPPAVCPICKVEKDRFERFM